MLGRVWLYGVCECRGELLYEELWVMHWCWVMIHVDGRCVLVVMGHVNLRVCVGGCSGLFVSPEWW